MKYSLPCATIPHVPKLAAAAGIANARAQRHVTSRRAIVDSSNSLSGRFGLGVLGVSGGELTGAVINVGGQDGFTLAAERDATATASTSGHADDVAGSLLHRRKAAIIRNALVNRSSSGTTVHAQNGTSAAQPTATSTSSSQGLNDNSALPAVTLPPPSESSQPDDADGPAALSSEIAAAVAAAVAAAAQTVGVEAAADSAPSLSLTAASPPVSTADTGSESAAPWVPPTHDSDYDLYLELQACGTWRDVLDVIADEAASFTPRTSVQALIRLQKLSGQEVAAVVSHPAFPVLLAAVTNTVEAMNPVQLSNSLYSLSRLRGTAKLPAELWKKHCATVGKTAAAFYPRDLSTIFNAYSKLKLSPGNGVLNKLGFRAKTLLDQGDFEPQGISMLLVACVNLGYRNTLLLEAAAAAELTVMAHATPQGVANCAWALSRLRAQTTEFLERCKRYAVEHATRFQPQEAANLLYACTQHRFHPQEALGTLTLKCFTPRLASLRPADVSTLLHCMSTFFVNPGEELVARLCQQLQLQISDCSLLELTQTFRALGLMSETSQPLFGALAERLRLAYEKGDLEDEGLMRQTFQGLIAAQVAGDEDSVAFPPAMLEALKRAWMTGVHTTAAANANESGQPRLGQLRKILSYLRVSHDLRQPSKDGLMSVDVAIQAGRDRHVALQLVNEDEHTCNTNQILGSVQLQRQVLENNGWEVRHLLMRDLMAVAPVMRPMFVAELLLAAGVRVTVPTGPVDLEAAAAAAAAGRAADKMQPSGLRDADLVMKTARPPLRPRGAGGISRGRGGTRQR